MDPVVIVVQIHGEGCVDLIERFVPLFGEELVSDGSKSVFASNPGIKSSINPTSGQTSSNGSVRVFQLWGIFDSLGSCCNFKYLRAVFSSIPNLAATGIAATK